LVDASKYFPGIMMLSALSDYLVGREKWRKLNVNLSPLILLHSQPYELTICIFDMKGVKNTVDGR
jgi:hypothetical protein